AGPAMLQLAAKYADSWNTLSSEPSVIATRMAALNATCGADGRDPATLEAAAYVHLLYRDLLEQPVPLEDPLQGTAADLAAMLQTFEALGLAQVMVRLHPSHEVALARFSEALGMYHSR